MKTPLAVMGAAVLLMAVSACASTQEPPTADQRAACKKMLAEMGEGATHSHATDKSGAVNTMGMTHTQCRRMLGR